MYRTMAKYYAIYPILSIVLPNSVFAYLSAGYGSAQNDAKVLSSDSDTVKPVKPTHSRSLCKAMKNANKQAAGFCLWCDSFANQNKCLTSQHFKCGKAAPWAVGRECPGPAVAWPGCCLHSAAARRFSSLACQRDIKQH